MNKSASVLVLFLVLSAYTFAQDSPYYISVPNFENNHWLFYGEDDTISGSWSYLSPLSVPLIGVNTYFRADSNSIFICGGIDSGGFRQTACYAYNIQSNSYSLRAPMPEGRWSGKLVRVKDSLYLVGSIGADFSNPDGKIFSYSLNSNSWRQSVTMPAPFLHECAVCVIGDSLIMTIGGSTDRFQGATSIIRFYDPLRGKWITSQSIYPLNTTSAHAEYNMTEADTSVVVLGGFGAVINDAVYDGRITVRNADTIFVTWGTLSLTPFDGGGVYRVSGGKWQDMMLFGPGLRNSSTVGQIYGLRIYNSEFHWTKFMPDVIDTTSNIPNIAVRPGNDTAVFYFFGGYKNPNFSPNVKSITAYKHLDPIGIEPISSAVSNQFKLYQNYPNPFNPSTRIKYSVPKPGMVSIVVYDILGREVTQLLREFRNRGTYETVFDAGYISSGVYFYVLKADGFMETKKMLLIK